jgi:hypothetical protein
VMIRRLRKVFALDRYLCIRLFIIVLAILALWVTCACTSSGSSPSSSSDAESQCTEPENPYQEDTGHHAGFEWAENSNPATCGGSSDSFIEGCEEYQRQESEYVECEARKHK